MGTTLAHGIYLPSEGERNCYAGLKVNWETLDQKVADISALQSAIAGALHREIVVSLPTTDIDTATIYMILNGTSATENIYDEYMYISNAWELIGTSATDLTNYYTKGEVDSKLLLKASASDLTSHTGDTTIHVTASDKQKWDTLALIKHLRLVNAQVGSATTIPFSDFDDTNGIKVGDKCMDLDAKMFEITAVDTTNQTVTVGSALIDLALDSNVVHTNEINSLGIGIIESVKEVGGVNFNTLTTQGLYGANASGSTNNPEASPCVVQVIRRQNSVIQIANVSSSAYKSRYIRYCADITAQSPVWQPWIKFATDDNVVHSTGNETVDGQKTFSKIVRIDGTSLGDESSTNERTDLCLRANRDTNGKSCAYISRFRPNKNQGELSDSDVSFISISFLENGTRYTRCFDFGITDWDTDGIPQTYYLTSPSGKGALGTSSRKWQTINGLEPSALGMPDLANAVDISGYVSVVANANKESLYTPPSNGWICVRLSRTSGALGVLLIQGDLAISGKNIEVESGVTTADATLPVVGGVQVSINSALADGIVSAKFVPCLGNV